MTLPFRSRPAHRRAAVALTAAALTLSACSPGSDDPEAGTNDGADAAEAAPSSSSTTESPDEPTTTAPPESSAAESSAPQAAEPAVPNPDPLPEVAPPGTQVAIGESVIVQKSIGVLPIQDGWAYLRYTVTGIEPGDSAIISDLTDPGDLAGGSAYYVRGTVEVLALEGAGVGGIVGGAIAGVQPDGAGASGVFEVGGERACAGDFIVSEAKVGDVAESCTIALVPPGAEVVGALYYADGTVTSGGGSDDPYFADPIVWRP